MVVSAGMSFGAGILTAQCHLRCDSPPTNHIWPTDVLWSESDVDQRQEDENCAC